MTSQTTACKILYIPWQSHPFNSWITLYDLSLSTLWQIHLFHCTLTSHYNARSKQVGFHLFRSLSYFQTYANICAVFNCPVWLCDPMDWSPLGSPVHGIFLASLLKWVAISFSRGSPNPGIEPMSLMSPALQTDSLPLSHWGSHAKICAPTNLNKYEVI